MIKIKRLLDKPIISPETDPSILKNINGPCLIKVPEWLNKPLGKYYLYFAHHQGTFIRLAYADSLTGPWKVYEPGVLPLQSTPFEHHIASPDVHIDDENRRIIMYYHGCVPKFPMAHKGPQVGCFASSKDGLDFMSSAESFGPPYMRVFKYKEWFYAFSGGEDRQIWRSKSYDEPFEPGNLLDVENEVFPEAVRLENNCLVHKYRMRHVAVDLIGDTAHVYVSNVGDSPERIRKTTIDLTKPWLEWKGTAFEEVIRPEMDWEGVNEKIEPSIVGASHHPVHQLRDPDIYREDGKTYLTYSVKGESGIAICEIVEGL
jgi:hypothetical protein